MKKLYAVLTSSDRVTYGANGETLLYWSKLYAEEKAKELNSRYSIGSPIYRAEEVEVSVTYEKVVTEKVEALC